MFPLADLRGRVLGFGARAMREGQQPKYLNTSDNEIYHKGKHLYGADLARVHATKAGAAILCEGYTDVIALHQAGFRNAVGLMGTALTEEQVGELSRLAQTVLLALDADSAGQEAMLKAHRLAERRKLELRVVELPSGMDPAELVQQGGVEAVKEALGRSLPFVRFRVERVLAAGDDSSPEGRDRTIDRLRPIFATLPMSAMRMELTRLVSGRLGLPESLAEGLLSQSSSSRPPATDGARRERASAHASGEERDETGRRQAQPTRALSVREQTERAFLAQCIASPPDGVAALKECDIDAMFTGALLREAAAHLREHSLEEPLRGLGERQPELVGLLAELVVEAGRWQVSGGEAHAATLEVQRLQLELASIERSIHLARTQSTGEVSELAHRRAEVKQRFDRAQERALAETGD
jgi:DNA primase